MRQGHGQGRGRIGHPFWQAPHRPLFAFAGLWALVAPLVWLLPDGISTDPVGWHLHELMFGMGGAAVGGYLLTALPAWTGRGPVPARFTLALTGLWIAGRLAFRLSDMLPPTAVAAATSAYLAVLGAYILRALLQCRLWSRLWVVAAICGLLLADLLIVSGAAAVQGRTGLCGVLLFTLLISAIGGRAVPAFTRHWLERRTVPTGLCDGRWLGRLSIGALAAGAAATFLDANAAAGGLLVLSGTLQFMRTAGWRSLRTLRYPALLLLHLAWLWLPAGLLLVGLALILPQALMPSAALHALTMGAMGTMMLAIMSRAAMVRQGDRLVLSPPLAAAFALVWLSAPIRIAAGSVAMEPLMPMRLASLFWIVGWVLFLCSHLRSLRRPVPRPVLSAHRRAAQ
ncbi:NnrS family protein (plasmid) [Rhizobium sp. TRM96647]|uniref:NnrS family protein n=1 Tax=unclassified Rhizobium TaxID=2613769 RepID=UPI0021E902B8|nr:MULTISPECIES: NnrS family protein [unclassified Rhizobium]MCV3735278.1 NnrS family protein [Rhizobium sp. TRM96647]MCV3757959.1 NnrS family protein [Rhizobium sp. TRM96650]